MWSMYFRKIADVCSFTNSVSAFHVSLIETIKVKLSLLLEMKLQNSEELARVKNDVIEEF